MVLYSCRAEHSELVQLRDFKANEEKEKKLAQKTILPICWERTRAAPLRLFC